MDQKKEIPISGAYWVVPGKLLAGEHPGGADLCATRGRVAALLRAGVSLFIDLTQSWESHQPYADILEEGAHKGDHPARRVNYPIDDFSTPTVEAMTRVLDAIDGEIERGGMVYLHCLAGIGRTGTAVGCHLVRHGFSTGEGGFSTKTGGGWKLAG